MMAPEFLTTILFAILWQQASTRIVPTEIATQGDSYTITCSAGAIGLLDPARPMVTIVQLEYREYDTAKPETVMLLDYTMYLLSANNPTAVWKQEIVPQGKNNWRAIFPTSDTLNNGETRDTMTLQLQINKAGCQDSGEYYCQVKVIPGLSNPADSVTQTDSELFNVTAGTPENIRSTVVPDVNMYAENQTFEMTCSIDGPGDVKYNFFWKRSRPQGGLIQGFEPYPYQNDISTHTRQIIIETDGSENICGSYKHSQTLTFAISKDDNERTIKCEFGTGFNSNNNLQANRTIYVKDEGGNNGGDSGKSVSSASNDDLVIGLTVSLLLVAILVVAVLVYACWWRKRTPNNKYKDEPDQGDANNSHAPPPVFYSKPNKPPKDDADPARDNTVSARDGGGMTNKALDNSYDSRDNGPPRYVNHGPVESGPPTYNSHEEPYDPHYQNPPVEDMPRSREPYAGQYNTAYDGGEPEPEGRKYTRGRARSNRTDRLNSSRSTEDGSVSYSMGDAAVGTSI